MYKKEQKFVKLVESFLKEEKVLYNCVLLDPESKKQLLEKFPPKHPKVFAEHVTLQFAPKERVQNLGEAVKLKVIGYAEDDKGQAVTVELPNGLTSKNKIPHVTISVTEKPVYSNELLAKGFQKVEPFELSGVIAENIDGKFIK